MIVAKLNKGPLHSKRYNIGYSLSQIVINTIDPKSLRLNTVARGDEMSPMADALAIKTVVYRLVEVSVRDWRNPGRFITIPSVNPDGSYNYVHVKD